MFVNKNQIPKMALSCLLLLSATSLLAQKPSLPPPKGNICYVEIIDQEKALKAWKEFERTDDLKAAEILGKKAFTRFAEFETVFEEEKNNIHVYPFPNGKSKIITNVFYTDESMASHGKTPGHPYNVVSIKLMLALVSGKLNDPEEYEFSTNDMVFRTEFTYDDYTNIIRMHSPVFVNNKKYTIGMHCDFLAKDRKERVPNF